MIFCFENYGNNTLATCHAKDNSVIFYFENYILCIEIEMWDVGGGFAMAKAPLIFVMVKATLGIFFQTCVFHYGKFCAGMWHLYVSKVARFERGRAHGGTGGM